MTIVEQDTKLSVGDISQMLEVVTTLAEQDQCTPSEAIRRIATILFPNGSQQHERASLAQFSGRLRRLRVRRNELIGAPLFRDPAWDMLLELFASHESGRRVSISSLCLASGVPPSTALRQVDRLEKHGLITRVEDASDNRRCYVEPTAKAVAGVASIAAMMLDESTSHPR